MIVSETFMINVRSFILHQSARPAQGWERIRTKETAFKRSERTSCFIQSNHRKPLYANIGLMVRKGNCEASFVRSIGVNRI